MDNLAVLLIFGIWNLVLTIFAVWFVTYFKGLTKGVKEADFKKVLDSVIAKEKANTAKVTDLAREVQELDHQVLGHVQKVGLVKFNPFAETGGDHSFSLAVLDGGNNGFILTGLHARERTRFYIKEVKSGKTAIELSKEERAALKKAVK